MDGTQEGNDDGSVAELDGFDGTEKPASALVIQQKGVLEGATCWPFLTKIPCQVECRERGGQIGNGAAQPKDAGLSWDIRQAECVLDDGLLKVRLLSS